MPKPNHDDLDYDALTDLIDEATKLRSTKFGVGQQDQKRPGRETEMDTERKVDPFRSPTA